MSIFAAQYIGEAVRLSDVEWKIVRGDKGGIIARADKNK